jgi:hypothetical protein
MPANVGGCCCGAEPPIETIECLCPIPLTDLSLRAQTSEFSLEPDEPCPGPDIYPATDLTHTLAYGGEHGTLGHWWATGCVTFHNFPQPIVCGDGETVGCPPHIAKYFLICLEDSPTLVVVYPFCSSDGTGELLGDCDDYDIDDVAADLSGLLQFTLEGECCCELRLFYHEIPPPPEVPPPLQFQDFDITYPGDPIPATIYVWWREEDLSNPGNYVTQGPHAAVYDPAFDAWLTTSGVPTWFDGITGEGSPCGTVETAQALLWYAIKRTNSLDCEMHIQSAIAMCFDEGFFSYTYYYSETEPPWIATGAGSPLLLDNDVEELPPESFDFVSQTIEMFGCDEVLYPLAGAGTEGLAITRSTTPPAGW